MELSAVPPCSYGSLVAYRDYQLDTAQLILLLFGGSVPLEFLSKLKGVAPQSRETQSLHCLRGDPAQQNEFYNETVLLLETSARDEEDTSQLFSCSWEQNKSSICGPC